MQDAPLGSQQRDKLLASLTECVQQLTRPYTHTERYAVRTKRREITKPYRTRHPSLLDQLRDTIHTTRCAPDETTHGRAIWTAPADLAALDAYARITSGAAYWAGALGCGHTTSPEHALHAIAHTATALPGTELGHVTRAVERWHTIARIETGWDAPPRDLRVPCPYCAARRLRVQADASAAWCRNCQTTWDATTIGVLAAMIGGPS